MSETNPELMLDDELLDDLADLPSIAPYPPGAHQAKMTITKKPGKPAKDGKAATAPSYQAMFEYIAPMELVDPSKTPPNAGDKSFVNIFTKKKDGTPNEFGQGQLKLLVAPIAEKIGTSSVNEVIEASKNGIEVAIVTGIKKGQDGYQDQMTVTKLMLV